MKKIVKTIIKFIIIAIVLLAVLKACFGKDDKQEPKQSEPQVVEKQEEPKLVEEQPQEVVEVEQEPEIEVQEDPTIEEEAVDQNGIRPEFQKSMESYEAFFDEYIEFMNAFKQDSTSLSMLTKYAEFMAKYEKAMTEMDNIDESELNDAENKLFLETQLRINNKLTEVAINY